MHKKMYLSTENLFLNPTEKVFSSYFNYQKMLIIKNNQMVDWYL
jgi:hypothetical protein